MNTDFYDNNDYQRKIPIEVVHNIDNYEPELLKKMGWEFEYIKKSYKKANFGYGQKTNLKSQRIETFKKSTSCICCGIKSSYYKKFSHNKDISPHLNLYANENGIEILMTKDHILPKSLGGKDIIENYTTACITCNNFKGNSTLTWDEIREIILHEKNIHNTIKLNLNPDIIISKIKIIQQRINTNF